MNKKNILIFINPLLVLLFIVSLIEAGTYAGYLMKHISMLIITVAAIILFIFVFIFKKINGTIFLKKTIFILTIFAIIIYLGAIFLENISYTNYVFSHFHFHPDLMLMPVILLSLIFMLNEPTSRTRTLLLLATLLVFVQYAVGDFAVIKQNHPIYIFQNLNMTYDKKMEKIVGKLIYGYTSFIISNTPPTSSILIPPQGFPWPQTGNAGYLRYLTFPRKLINGGEMEAKVDIKDVDFVLIDYGESDSSQYGFTNMWPKFNVPAEYVLYWDKDSGTISRVDGDYVYNSNDSSEKWGLIKVKK